MKQRIRVQGSANDSPEASSRPSFRMSCTWCGVLHEPRSPLEFNPVCSVCAQRQSTMRLLEMSGSFPLDHEVIDRRVAIVSPGNYALGYVIDEDFTVFYVGRSESDIGSHLHAWVGMPTRFDRYAPARNAPWELRSGGAMPLGRPAFGQVSAGEDTGYTRFAYSYAASPAAAFAKQCRNYLDFGGCHDLDNERAPTRGFGA